MRQLDAFFAIKTKLSLEVVMEKILNVSQMKKVDKNTVEIKKMPSLVLIENAANAVVSFIKSKFDKNIKIGIFAGNGNNGADAICAARILTVNNYKVDLYLIPSIYKKTDEYIKELEIARNYQINIIEEYIGTSYDLLIDGIFGIGLNRDVTGVYLDCIRYINQNKGIVISLDVPSGLNGNNGTVMGIAVRADYTITFVYKKTGLLLNDGPNYTGIVSCENIGFLKQEFNKNPLYINSYERIEKIDILKRKKTGNKGTFGKVLIFAGNKEYGGAVSLVTLSTYRAGSGMVHIITHSSNKKHLLEKNPEVIISCYDDKNFIKTFESTLLWADVIVAGPGIGLEAEIEVIFDRIITHIVFKKTIPLIIDADALTILSKQTKYLEQLKNCENIVCTPHVKEFARLYNTTVSDVKENMIELVTKFSKKYRMIIICKDAKTYIHDGLSGKSYLNQSGNHGMATAGSGDVLTGIIASLISQGMNCFEASYKGVHLHGQAGDFAEKEFGRGLIATDLINSIKKVF